MKPGSATPVPAFAPPLPAAFVSASSLDLKSTRLDALLLPLASRDWEAALHSMRTQWAAVAGAFDGELLVLDLRGLPPQGAPVPWLRIKQILAELGLNAVGVQPQLGQGLLDAQPRCQRYGRRSPRAA